MTNGTPHNLSKAESLNKAQRLKNLTGLTQLNREQIKDEFTTLSVTSLRTEETVIDRTSNVIKKALLLKTGLTSDARFKFTSENLSNFSEVAGSMLSIKVHFEHSGFITSPGEHSLKFLGEVKNVILSSDKSKAYGDIEFSKAALNFRGGEMVRFVIDRVESDELDYGLSIVFSSKRAWNEYDEGRKPDEPMMTLLEFQRVVAADFVEFPAATTTIKMNSDNVDNIRNGENSTTLNNNLNINQQTENSNQFKGELMNHKRIMELATKLGLSAAETQKFIEMGTTTEEVLAAIEAHYEQLGVDARILALKTNADALTLAQSQINGDTTLTDITGGGAEGEEGQAKPSGNTIIKLTKDQFDNKAEMLEMACLTQQGIDEDPRNIAEVAKTDIGAIGLRGLLRQVAYLHNDTKIGVMSPTAMFNHCFVNLNAAPGTTSAFINILSNVLRKSATIGFALAKVTYDAWVAKETLKDFKTTDITSLTEFAGYRSTEEGKYVEYGAMSDYKEQAYLKSKGAMFKFTRIALINDDLGMFTRTPRQMLTALNREINRNCYQILFGTAFAGPAMLTPASKVLFATSQGNLTTTGTSVTETALDAMWNYFRRVRGQPPERGADPIALNLEPQWLIIPPEEEKATYKLTQSNLYNATDTAATIGSELENIYYKKAPRAMIPIVEPELELLDSSNVYPWYAAANKNLAATLTLWTLAGSAGPYTISAPVPAAQGRGIDFLVEHDWNFTSQDFRGIYCNKGHT